MGRVKTKDERGREGEREIEVQLKKIRDFSEVRVIFLFIHMYKNDVF